MPKKGDCKPSTVGDSEHLSLPDTTQSVSVNMPDAL